MSFGQFFFNLFAGFAGQMTIFKKKSVFVVFESILAIYGENCYSILILSTDSPVEHRQGTKKSSLLAEKPEKHLKLPILSIFECLNFDYSFA